MTARTVADIVMAPPLPKHHHLDPAAQAIAFIFPAALQHALPVLHQFAEGSLATARTLTAMATA
jgi:hypothetical protein